MFVGLDVSLSGTGLCIIRDSGEAKAWTYSAEGKNNKSRRDDLVRRVMTSITKMAEIWREDTLMVCAEQCVMHSTHMAGAAQLVTLAETMADEIVAAGLPLHKIPPMTLKKYVTGNGKADKPMMIRATQRYGFDPANDNEADAYGLAIMACDIIRHHGGDYSGITKDRAEILARYPGGR